MKVYFYLVSDDQRKLTKTLQNEKLVEVRLQDNCSLISPIIVIDGNSFRDFTEYNYVYIPYFKRYYFIGNSRFLIGDMIEIPLSVDVLMSFRESITQISTMIERQEHVWSPYIVDSLLPTKVSRQITRKLVGSLGTPSGAYFALTVIGGTEAVNNPSEGSV